MKQVLLCSLFIIVINVGCFKLDTADALIDCPIIAEFDSFLVEGRCLYVSPLNNMTPNEALEFCLSKGLRLAINDNNGSSNKIIQSLKTDPNSKDSYFFGFQDKGSDRVYHWNRLNDNKDLQPSDEKVICELDESTTIMNQ